MHTASISLAVAPAPAPAPPAPAGSGRLLDECAPVTPPNRAGKSRGLCVPAHLRPATWARGGAGTLLHAHTLCHPTKPDEAYLYTYLFAAPHLCIGYGLYEPIPIQSCTRSLCRQSACVPVLLGAQRMPAHTTVCACPPNGAPVHMQALPWCPQIRWQPSARPQLLLCRRSHSRRRCRRCCCHWHRRRCHLCSSRPAACCVGSAHQAAQAAAQALLVPQLLRLRLLLLRQAVP